MWGHSGMWELCVLFIQFCREPKTALNTIVYLKIKFQINLSIDLGRKTTVFSFTLFI